MTGDVDTAWSVRRGLVSRKEEPSPAASQFSKSLVHCRPMASGQAVSGEQRHKHRRSHGRRSSGHRGSSRRYFGRYSKRQVQQALFLSVVVAVSLVAGYLVSQ